MVESCSTVWAQGFNVACVQNPLTSIADDVAATHRIINAQDGPVILAGHSYGGAIITEAGNNPKVVGLVYVAAFARDEGETLAGLAQPYGATPLFGQIQPIEDGFLLLTPQGVREDFARIYRLKKKIRWLRLRPPLKGPFSEPRLARPHGTPSPVGLLLPRMIGQSRPSRKGKPLRGWGKDAYACDQPRCHAREAGRSGELHRRSSCVRRRRPTGRLRQQDTLRVPQVSPCLRDLGACTTL